MPFQTWRQEVNWYNRGEGRHAGRTHLADAEAAAATLADVYWAAALLVVELRLSGQRVIMRREVVSTALRRAQRRKRAHRLADRDVASLAGRKRNNGLERGPADAAPGTQCRASTLSSLLLAGAHTQAGISNQGGTPRVRTLAAAHDVARQARLKGVLHIAGAIINGAIGALLLVALLAPWRRRAATDWVLGDGGRGVCVMPTWHRPGSFS